TLVVAIDPAPGLTGDRVGDVELELLLEALLLPIREDRVHEVLDILGAELRVVLQPEQVAVHPHERRSARHQVEVGGVSVRNEVQDVEDRQSGGSHDARNRVYGRRGEVLLSPHEMPPRSPNAGLHRSSSTRSHASLNDLAGLPGKSVRLTRSPLGAPEEAPARRGAPLGPPVRPERGSPPWLRSAPAPPGDRRIDPR